MIKLLKNFFRFIYHKVDRKIEKETLDFLKKYYNLSEKKIFYLLKSGSRLNADFWFCTNPKTELEIAKFYEETPFYIFSLIYWQGTRYQRNLRNTFANLAKGRVLDYGGGVGDLCAKIRQKGLVVDYADVQGRTFNFATSFFKEHNLNINIINLSKERITFEYDTIFCVDVIEHIISPKDLLKEFVDHLSIGGQLVITALAPHVSDKSPMHFHITFNPEEYLKSLGMEKKDHPFVWIKK